MIGSPRDVLFVKAWCGSVFDGPAEVAGSALMLLVRRCAGDTTPWMVAFIGDLSRQRWYVSSDDAWLAARAWLAGADEWFSGWALDVVVLMLRRVIPDDEPITQEQQAFVKVLVASIDARRRLGQSDAQQARTRLLRLLPSDDTSVDTNAIADVDGWASHVLPRLSALSDDAPAVNSVLRHLLAANGSKPSKSWLSRLRPLLAEPVGSETIRIVLDGVLHSQPQVGEMGIAVDPRHVDLIRAAAWAAGTLDADWVVPTLDQVTRHGMGMTGQWADGWMASEKVPNAGIVALGAIASPPAIAALQRLGDVTRNNGFRKRIAGALAVAAESAGLTPGQLVEQTVPTGGLDPDGTCVLHARDVAARLHVSQNLKVTLSWQRDAEWSAKPSPDVDAADVSQIKRQTKELRTLIAGERRRVEGLFASDRAWDLDDWRRYYLEHPITGRLTRQLIWCFETDGLLTGIPQGGGLQTLTGHVQLPATGKVRLWHPATEPTDEIEKWRQLFLDGEFVQPFKQAFREVYLLTPAEQETVNYSNRFAAHVVHYQQLYALFKERAWVSNYLGAYDGGYEGRARHDFPDVGITAVFEHAQVDGDAGAFRTELASTDRVWFFRTRDRGRHAVPFDEVPPLVFSEAMRDVDLFIGVTSIALDPTWADRQTEPHFAYWLSASFGALAETAQVRREVLAELLPKLKIADRVQLEDTYIRVRGNLAEYKVHLGSANVLIEPDDRYLCIVPTTSGRKKHVMLPFDGDDVLSLVLSKVVMLAADDKITDHTIVQQIQRRR
jgi:Domain of unknown function (DUF4132)